LCDRRIQVNEVEMEALELVIFDMAGTTVQDRGQVPEAFLGALRAYGMDATAQAVSAVRGASKREAIRRLVKDAGSDVDPEQVYTAFCERLAELFSAGGAAGSVAMPGAAETFAWLRARGVKVALNTGFDREIMQLVLDCTGWERDWFAALVCGEDVSQGRPAPYLIFRAIEVAGASSVRRTAVVGDTVLDLQAGWNAGVGWNIGVLSGAHTREQLERAPHDLLLPGVADLPGAWDVIAG
jgi:phosphonatase-like hydrolase